MSLWVAVPKEAAHTFLLECPLRIERTLSALLDSKRHFKDREWGHRSQNTLLETQSCFLFLRSFLLASFIPF